MRRSSVIAIGVVAAILAGYLLYVHVLKLERKVAQEQQQAEVALMTDRDIQAQKRTKYPVAKEITTPDGFINSEPFALADYIGEKVILLEFWTYSCINCQRVLPYLNSWYDKYEDDGLLVVGVHTPEFGFEKKYENVLAATKEFGVRFPVVLDNDYATWRTYRNNFWPRKYLIDIDGFIVYDHIGEGAYEETERKIQELLMERKERMRLETQPETGFSTVEAERVDASKKYTPEIYFGALRNTRLGNGEQQQEGVQQFEEPPAPDNDMLYLAGEWDVTDEYAQNNSAGQETKIIISYSADKVFFVARSDVPVNVQVVQDGRPVEGADSGEDVDQGVVTVREDRLYRVIDNSAGHGRHTLELIISQPGAQFFTFTFG